MKRIASNDSSGLRLEQASNIYQEHSDFIYKAIRCRVRSDIEAEDIFQQFFLSLVKHPVPGNITNIKSYLNKAVNNDVVDEVRKVRRYKARVYKYTYCLHKRQGTCDPSDLASRMEDTENILNLLENRLPPYESRTIIKRHYQGKEIVEIAEELGANQRSVSRYLCTGLKKIRRLAMKCTNAPQ